MVDNVPGVRLRGRSVARDGGVIDGHDGAPLAGDGHLSLIEARAVDDDSRATGGAASERRDRIDHREDHKTAAELVLHGDDGVTEVVDSDGDGVGDTDGESGAGAETAHDVRLGAVDHLTGLIAHSHLQDAETPESTQKDLSCEFNLNLTHELTSLAQVVLLKPLP